MKRSSHVIRVRGRWRFPLSVAAGVTRAGHGRAAAQLSKQTCVSYVGGAPAWRGRVAAEVWTGQVYIGHAGGTLAEHRRIPAHCHGRGVRWRTAESLLSGWDSGCGGWGLWGWKLINWRDKQPTHSHLEWHGYIGHRCPFDDLGPVSI